MTLDLLLWTLVLERQPMLLQLLVLQLVQQKEHGQLLHLVLLV